VDDILFIVVTLLFFVASGGLIAICERLMEQKS
jgi:uncharacterized protein YneF (UPF0154 family)